MRRGTLASFAGVPYRRLAERFGTPVYVTDESRIRANVRRLHGAFASRVPSFRIHYAVKANNNPAILSVIRQEGCGADCSTPSEIELALGAGFRRTDLLYTGNYQSDAELAASIRARVIVNLDDDRMLPRLLRHGRPPALSFRLNPGIGEGKFKGLVFGGADSKFGIPEPRALAGYRAAKRAGIESFGIHMMAGSCVLRPAFFQAAVSHLLGMARRIASGAGISFSFVNIGGGFGVPYAPGERALDVAETARRVSAAFLGVFPAGPIPRLLVEPGRYLVCDSTELLTRVQWIKRNGRTYAGVDAGMHTLLRPALYGAYHPIRLVSRPPAGRERVNVCGPICENTDVLARGRALPRLRLGDLLSFSQAGAYGFAMSSQYNSRPRAGEVLVAGGRSEWIRRPERVSDLNRLTRIPARLRP